MFCGTKCPCVCGMLNLRWLNQNNLAMNRSVAQIARHFIQGDNIKEGMLNRVEAGIRAFDPCLSCSTHAMGQMPLLIEVVNKNGTVINQICRN